jgi:cell wall-associated NlpC family hydrolase
MRRAAVVVVALAAASGAAVYAGATGAGAAPTPSISDVQKQVNGLQVKVDAINQRYDAAAEQVTAAQGRLAQVTAIAVSSYENGAQTSIIGLLTSGSPDQVLSQASLLLQVEGTDNLEATQLLSLAKELSSIKVERQRTKAGVVQVEQQLAAQKTSLTTLLGKQKAVLASLTVQQQEQVAQTTVGGTTATTPSSTPVTYSGPTSTQAEKAVAFAYAQIGKPYLYGGTGPDSFDCSGLVQAAWAAAGVAIPRDTYEQWAGLPHIPMSELEPGDLIEYEAEGHVAMYVGNGMIIDAPHTGAFVELISMNTDWYAQSEDGALRP